MSKDEYVIINESKLLRKIEELKESLKDEPNPFLNTSYQTELDTLKQILSQSTPLIPEIEKVFDAGQEFGMTLFYNTDKIKQSRVEFESTFDKEEYISNLKLDI